MLEEISILLGIKSSKQNEVILSFKNGIGFEKKKFAFVFG